MTAVFFNHPGFTIVLVLKYRDLSTSDRSNETSLRPLLVPEGRCCSYYLIGSQSSVHQVLCSGKAGIKQIKCEFNYGLEVTDEMTARTKPGLCCEACEGKVVQLSPQLQSRRTRPALAHKGEKEDMGLDMVAHACSSNTKNAGAGASH